MPDDGVSALSALADLLCRTEKWLPAESQRPHPLLSPTTCVATMAKAGIAHNIVPGKASAIYNLRFLPWQKADEITTELRTLAEQVAARRPGISCSVEQIAALQPSEVEPDAPVAQALHQAIKDVTGTEPRFVGVGGATLCKQLIGAGIPAVAFGPGDEHFAHMADERIAVDELVKYTAVVIAATLLAVGK
jgi:acetylornithine deacetylase/succinyl-diaminopimelate desuccinylase-like protein